MQPNHNLANDSYKMQIKINNKYMCLQLASSQFHRINIAFKWKLLMLLYVRILKRCPSFSVMSFTLHKLMPKNKPSDDTMLVWQKSLDVTHVNVSTKQISRIFLKLLNPLALCISLSLSLFHGLQFCMHMSEVCV